MTTYTAYDAAFPSSAVPDDGDVYLAYIGYAPNPSSFEQMSELHPGKTVSIGYGNPSTLVQDCESGAATPAEAAGAAHSRVGSGGLAVIYAMDSDAGSYTAVTAELKTLGLEWSDPASWPAPGVYWWSVGWTGKPHVDTGAIGTQYLSANAYDQSEFLVDLLESPQSPSDAPQSPATGSEVSSPIPAAPAASTTTEEPEVTAQIIPAGQTVAIFLEGKTGVRVACPAPADNPGHVTVAGTEHTLDNTQTLYVPAPTDSQWFINVTNDNPADFPQAVTVVPMDPEDPAQ